MSLVAVTLELLPEKLSFIGTVLSAAGLGTIIGSFIAWRKGLSRERRAIYAEDLSLLFAGVMICVFPLGALIQEIFFD